MIQEILKQYSNNTKIYTITQILLHTNTNPKKHTNIL